MKVSVQTVEFDGTYYGVPISTESVAFFYNKTLLDEYGFEVAETWDEIKAKGMNLIMQQKINSSSVWKQETHIRCISS